MLTLFVGLLLLLGAIVILAKALAPGDEAQGVDRSLAAIAAMSSAPAEIRADLEPPFADRVLAPLQARALGVGRRLSGADSTARIRRQLDLAGNPRDWSVDRVVSLKVIAAVVLGVVGFAYSAVFSIGLGGQVLVGVAGLLIGFYAPTIYLSNRAQKRAEQMERALPDALDLLTISVEAGLGFDGALQQVSRNTEGPLAEEFNRVLREMQIGQSRSASLRALSERTNVPTVRTFVSALVQADAFGIPIASVLRVQSGEIRVKRRQRAEMKAQQVPVKITIPVILFVLPCLFVVVMGPAVIQVLDNF